MSNSYGGPPEENNTQSLGKKLPRTPHLHVFPVVKS